MVYKEFQERIKFTVPNKEQSEKLISGLDSMHFACCLGIVFGNEYKITISSEMMEHFCSVLDILENRGAIKGEDYIVCAGRTPKYLTVEIHTTHSFLSDEDFDKSIKRYYSK